RQMVYYESILPIPPAPTRPSTAEVRMLISNRYSAKDISEGAAAGHSAHRVTSAVVPPAARTASEAPSWADSIVSYTHLPWVPIPAIPSARAPVNGVRPVTVSRMRAMMTSGNARMIAKNRRRMNRSQAGPTPRAASIPRGMETTTHPIAPSQAIEMDRQVWNRARGNFSQLGSANISFMYSAIWPGTWSSSLHLMSSPAVAARTTAPTTTAAIVSRTREGRVGWLRLVRGLLLVVMLIAASHAACWSTVR